MVFSMQEVACVFFALNQDKEGKPRRFQFVDLIKVNGIADKLKSCLKGDQLENKDYKLDFTAEETVFLLEKIKEIDWQMGDSKAVLSLTEKLK